MGWGGGLGGMKAYIERQIVAVWVGWGWGNESIERDKEGQKWAA